MVDVCELTKFTASGKVLRLGRLWQTAILGKWNPLFYAAPVENMVYSHQRQYYRALHRSQVTGDAAPFVEFMLNVILRTIKAIEKNIRILKDAQRLRRIGPDKGGRWEVA